MFLTHYLEEIKMIYQFEIIITLHNSSLTFPADKNFNLKNLAVYFYKRQNGGEKYLWWSIWDQKMSSVADVL